MPEPNSANTAKGRRFQEAAAILLSKHFGVTFNLEQAIAIGAPPKLHRFDLVSSDGRYVCETKNYCWTEGGNVPSAKMGFLNEAVFFLQHTPAHLTRYVVLRNDCHPKKGTLAQYYAKSYNHLLNGVGVLELDLDCSKVFEVVKAMQ